MTLVIDPKVALLKGVDPVQFCVFKKPCEPKNSMRAETTRFLSVFFFFFFQLQALSRDGTQTHRKREFKTLILIKDTIL